MSLTSGTRLGVYEITAKLGEGGMGAVFRARDTKLDRDVAIKILPEAFAHDADRLARFTREAKTLASLNHPNIAGIHGLEESGGITALVMELVDGEDLSTLIARGPLPLSDALPIARQIAEALEAAHEQGIIHRDLKPANIKVRADGTVKVLDFGLAKAMEPAGGASSSAGSLANSPTMTSPAMTAMGMILGTAAYMAPEQARGRPVDKRADIWAFGVVLYEMLSGRRAFEGEDMSITLANVMKDDVAWDALPKDLPAPLARLLRRCLEKDPKKRLRDIGEARLLLDAIIAGAPDDAVAPAPAVAVVRPVWRRAVPWMIAGLALVVAGAAVVLWSAARSTPPLEARRLLAAIGADAYLVPFSDDYQGSAVAVSPDGKTLIFMGVRKAADSRPQLFVRKLDQLQATPLDGTEGAFAPFFSPDSEWVAFFVESGQTGTLKKIPVGGGAVVKICDTAFPRGGWWSENGTIVFGQISKPTTTLLRVASAGGTPVAFGAFSPGATSQRWPQVLPGGTHVIYTEHSNVSRFDYANLMVVPLNGGAPKVVVKGGFYGRSVTIGSKGYLTYVRQSTLMASTLMAVPFDLSRMETTGPAVPVVEDVALAGNGGSASVAMLPDGALVYVPATDVQTPVAIQWLSREGKISLWRTATNGRRDGQFSRDGQQFAFTERGQPRQLFVQSLTREIPTQVAAPGGATSPVWTPDGKRVAFGLDQGVGVSNLWMANADGSGTPTRLTTSTNDQQPSSWDPTGKWLAYTEIRPNTTRDVMILPVQDNATDGWTAGPPIVFKGTAVNERDPAFSPDGRWIAYEADDIYVSPFPGPGATVRMSSEGGSTPQWSATSKELLFLSRGKIMSVSYTAADTFTPGVPKPWALQDGARVANFVLHPDGKRAAVVLVDADAEQRALFARDKIVFWSGFGDVLRKNVAEEK